MAFNLQPSMALGACSAEPYFINPPLPSARGPPRNTERVWTNNEPTLNLGGSMRSNLFFFPLPPPAGLSVPRLIRVVREEPLKPLQRGEVHRERGRFPLFLHDVSQQVLLVHGLSAGHISPAHLAEAFSVKPPRLLPDLLIPSSC